MDKSEVQLKFREIKEFRELLLDKQKGVCPLCKEPIGLDEATLDHDYVSGRCRAVLHNSCNGAEGQILKWSGRRSRGQDPHLFLKNLLAYWKKDYSHNPLHPKQGRPVRKKKRRTRAKR